MIAPLKVANMTNTVQLLPNDIISAARTGGQTEASVKDLYAQITKLASKLRSEAKPVLILSDVTDELPLSDPVERLVIDLGMHLDFDKCAFFPASGRSKSVRDVKVYINGFDVKVQNFASKEEALHWLQSFRYASGVSGS